MPDQSGTLNAAANHIGSIPIPNERGISHGNLSESGKLSTAPFALDVDIRNGSIHYGSVSRQHNHRYSKHADERAEAAFTLPAEPAESQCSTIIESGSLTGSCLTSPSQLPWSPLGHHPLESRCASMDTVLVGSLQPAFLDHIMSCVIHIEVRVFQGRQISQEQKMQFPAGNVVRRQTRLPDAKQAYNRYRQAHIIVVQGGEAGALCSGVGRHDNT